ncbi:hypothetical protein D3C75_720410 [compost metagenome]
MTRKQSFIHPNQEHGRKLKPLAAMNGHKLHGIPILHQLFLNISDLDPFEERRRTVIFTSLLLTLNPIHDVGLSLFQVFQPVGQISFLITFFKLQQPRQ